MIPTLINFSMLYELIIKPEGLVLDEKPVYDGCHLYINECIMHTGFFNWGHNGQNLRNLLEKFL